MEKVTLLLKKKSIATPNTVEVSIVNRDSYQLMQIDIIGGDEGIRLSFQVSDEELEKIKNNIDEFLA